MKFVGGIVLGLMLATAFFLTRPVPVPEQTQKDFQSLTANEAKAFAEAKTPEDKLKAAEALYGKMMVLFLANLGLELKKSAPVEMPVQGISDESSLKLAETKSRPEASAPLTCPPCAQVASTTQKKEEKNQTVSEKFGSTPYFSKMTPELRNILGTFSGQLTFTAGEKRGRVDSVLFIADLQQGGPSRTLKGEVQVILTDDTGKTYSRNVGKGGNKSIRFNPRDGMVYIEASPVSFFAVKGSEFRRNAIRAEYYDEDKLVGRAVLFRQ